jgi:D-arabinose 1-dehydrogenase-like Zn-dependent alcohol dehydrogenase
MPTFNTFTGSPSGAILSSSTTLPLSPHSVLIKITHSGLCGTDAHYKHTSTSIGHEGAGIIESLGSTVTTLKLGDRVGWGYLHSSCGHCKECLRGTETFCPERHMYGTHDLEQGSLGSHAIWDADFVFKIPDEISNEDAAPLMCGGATVFNALVMHGATSTDRVGIIGVGGLGHLAIQFASKMGCEVVVFSGTESKKKEALGWGATKFVAMKDLQGSLEEELGQGGKIDHLLVTTSQQPDWKMFLPVMAPGGTVYPLGVSEGDLTMPYMPIVLTPLRIQGSLVAARGVHKEMLKFAARHGVRPVVQRFPMTVDGIESAFAKLEDGSMRYRGVLVAE